MKIRPATEADRDAIWNIFHEVVADGDTYALDPKIAREDALAYWFGAGYAHLRCAATRYRNRWHLYFAA
jgi:L-amino acid N-acyltransferase YncA